MNAAAPASDAGGRLPAPAPDAGDPLWPAAPDAGVLARLPARERAGAAAAALALAALFWSPLLLGGSLHGFDWGSHHFHYFDWVRISLREYAAVPLYMADAWVTPNFAANAEAPTLGPLAWLLLVLPTGAYVKLLVVVFTALGLLGGYVLLREQGVSRPAASFAAVCFAWGGFFAAHVSVGHHWAMGAHLLPGLVWLYRRAALGSGAALAGAALANAAVILGGQHQPFIWQNLFLGGFAALWALRARALFPLVTLCILWVAAAGLGAVKLAPLLLEFADYDPSARIPGLPAGSLLASLVGPGQGPETTSSRLVFAHGAGWWEYAFYLGLPALLLALAGCAAARSSWLLLVLAAAFAALALEPLPLWQRLEGLPVLRSQRAPSRFLVLALFALVWAAAPGLERLRARAASRRPAATAWLAWALVVLVGADLWLAARPWQQAALGPPLASRDHRPQPLALASGAARARLLQFAPNRLVYRVEADAPARVVLPLRFGRRFAEWEAGPFRPQAAGEWLALEVPAGEHEVALAYRPPGFVPGLALSALSLLCLPALVRWRGLRRALDRRAAQAPSGST
jgi:hypothetical protein